MTIEELKNFKLTDLEKKCFDYFCFNYKDLESNLDDNANFVDFYDVDMEHKVLRGVFSSLEQKGLIFFAECDEGTYYLSYLAVLLYFYLYERKAFEECSVEVINEYLERI